MASKSLLLSVRLIAFIIYLYSIYWQYVVRPPFITPQRRVYGQFIYLTYWNLLIQTGFFFLLLVNHLLKSKKIKSFIDTVFFSIAFPLSWIVTSTFWTIYSIDRELILPTRMIPYYPLWLNHSTHSMVAILTLLELFTEKRKPPSMYRGLTIFLSITGSYAIWSLFLRHTLGFWVYPFLEKMNEVYIALFYASSILMYSTCYYICYKIGNSIYQNNDSKSSIKQRKIMNKNN